MELDQSSVTIKELIGKLNTLRSHLVWTEKGFPKQIQAETAMVCQDVFEAMDRYHADDYDRRLVSQLFDQLKELENDLAEDQSAKSDPSQYRKFKDRLDRICCNIQLFLSDLEFPRLSNSASR